jgi:hypothetical protein
MMSWADLVRGPKNEEPAAEEEKPADADADSKESADKSAVEPAASEEVTRGPSSNGPSVEVSETSSEISPDRSVSQEQDAASSPEMSDSAEMADALSESEPRQDVDLMSSPLESPEESETTPRVSLRSSSEDGRSATPEKKTEPPPTPPETEKPVMQLKAKPKGLLSRIGLKSSEDKVGEGGSSKDDEEREAPSLSRASSNQVSSDAGGAPQSRKKYTPEFLLAYRTHSACLALPSEHNIPSQLLVQKGDGAAGDDANWRDGKRARRDDKKAKQTGKSTGKERKPQLQTSENSWAAANRNAKTEETEEATDTQVMRAISSILNKLTVEKYDSLYKKLVGETNICKETHVEGLMKQVFQKATTQHHYISMYTKLCMNMHQWLTENPIPGLSAEKGFKRILLNQCQESFEQYLTPPEGIEQLEGEEKFEAQVKYKRSMLGNMKFVGELLCKKMLSSKIIFQCVDQLLAVNNDETIETLAVFLTQIGPTFDTPDYQRFQALQETFEKVEKLSKSEKECPSARNRFLLRDLIEMRASGWNKKSLKNEPEGPMRIKDVAKMAAMEESGKTASGRKPDLQIDDGWSSVRGGAKPPGSTRATPQGGRAPGPPTPARPATGSNAFQSLERKKKTEKSSPKEQRGKKDEEKSKETVPAKAERPDDENTRTEFATEMQKCLRELGNSHDTAEAATRIRDFGLPASAHTDMLVKMITTMVDQKEPVRKVHFKLLTRLYGESIFEPGSLSDGLNKFIENTYPDMVIDLPILKSVIEKELFEELAPHLGDIGAWKSKLDEIAESC